MAVLSKEALIEKIRKYTGERTDDETISLIEDVTDTVGNEDGGDGEEWKKKYEENDKAWRKKYKERFESGGKPEEKEKETEPKEETYESLFE